MLMQLYNVQLTLGVALGTSGGWELQGASAVFAFRNVETSEGCEAHCVGSSPSGMAADRKMMRNIDPNR